MEHRFMCSTRLETTKRWKMPFQTNKNGLAHKPSFLKCWSVARRKKFVRQLTPKIRVKPRNAPSERINFWLFFGLHVDGACRTTGDIFPVHWPAVYYGYCGLFGKKRALNMQFFCVRVAINHILRVLPCMKFHDGVCRFGLVTSLMR